MPRPAEPAACRPRLFRSPMHSELPPRPPSPAGRATRYDALADEIAARLRPVCQHMSPEEFDAFVREVAALQLRYERRDAFRPRAD